MKLIEATIRSTALKGGIEQAGDTSAKPPQEWLAALANLQPLQTLNIHIKRANPRATLPDGTARLQITANCNLPTLRQGFSTRRWLGHCLPRPATHIKPKDLPRAEPTIPRKEADQLSTAYRELDTIILRRDKGMLWP